MRIVLLSCYYENMTWCQDSLCESTMARLEPPGPLSLEGNKLEDVEEGVELVFDGD